MYILNQFLDEAQVALSTKGVYALSKFKASRALSFTANRRKRFSDRQNMLPGPGKYELRLKTAGKETFSKYKSTIGLSFPHSPRIDSINKGSKKLVPGPGHYQTSTEFGSKSIRLSRCLSSQHGKENSMPISR